METNGGRLSRYETRLAAVRELNWDHVFPGPQQLVRVSNE
jgi:hypothetical protein